MNVSTQVALFIATSLAPSNKTEAALNMKVIFPLRALLIYPELSNTRDSLYHFYFRTLWNRNWTLRQMAQKSSTQTACLTHWWTSSDRKSLKEGHRVCQNEYSFNSALSHFWQLFTDNTKQSVSPLWRPCPTPPPNESNLICFVKKKNNFVLIYGRRMWRNVQLSLNWM